MAVIVRRYVFLGITDAELALFAGAVPAQLSLNASYSQVYLDVNIDDAIAGMIDNVDILMETREFYPTATRTPRQVFHVVAAGGETTIALPFARVNANYSVQLSLEIPAANGNKIIGVVATSKTTTQFDITMSAPLEAGDIINVTVEDL